MNGWEEGEVVLRRSLGGRGVLGWCILRGAQRYRGAESLEGEEKKGYIISGGGVVRVEDSQRAPCMRISVASSFMSAFLGGNPIPLP